MRLNDLLRELRIAYWRFRMEIATHDYDHVHAWLKMRGECMARSGAQVARMERKKGLA